MSVRISFVEGEAERRATLSSWPMKPAAPVMRMLIVVMRARDNGVGYGI